MPSKYFQYFLNNEAIWQSLHHVKAGVSLFALVHFRLEWKQLFSNRYNSFNF